jgi:16S rRNA (adenine1518-N6/adenine1519-N6)-dimethyltransferase
MASKPIMIVDENDQPVGSASKQEMRGKGLWHRVVRVMIENDQGQVLLQHRSPTKDIFPNTWDNSSAGHVDAGEDYETAVKRELMEELGLELPLTEIGRYVSRSKWQEYPLNRFTRVFKAKTNETPKKLEVGKVDDARWWDVAAVKQLIREHPDQASDGLIEVFERFY